MKKTLTLTLAALALMSCEKNKIKKACGDDYPYNEYIVYSAQDANGKDSIVCTFFNVVRVSEDPSHETYESPYRIEFTLNNPQGDFIIYGGDEEFKSGDSFTWKANSSQDAEVHFQNNLVIALNETYEPIGDFSWQANNPEGGTFTIESIDLAAGLMTATLEYEFFTASSFDYNDQTHETRKLELIDYPICTVAWPGFCDAVSSD